MKILDILNAGIRPEWDGSLEFAPNPILEWLGIQIIINRANNLALESMERQPWPYLVRRRVRPNSYQRRRARKPWLYERKF